MLAAFRARGFCSDLAATGRSGCGCQGMANRVAWAGEHVLDGGPPRRVDDHGCAQVHEQLAAVGLVHRGPPGHDQEERRMLPRHAQELAGRVQVAPAERQLVLAVRQDEEAQVRDRPRIASAIARRQPRPAAAARTGSPTETPATPAETRSRAGDRRLRRSRRPCRSSACRHPSPWPDCLPMAPLRCPAPPSVGVIMAARWLRTA